MQGKIEIILETAGFNTSCRTPDDKLRWAFKMYDEDNSREVDYQEMENVMKVSEAVKHSFNGNPWKISNILFIWFEYKI